VAGVPRADLQGKLLASIPLVGGGGQRHCSKEARERRQGRGGKGWVGRVCDPRGSEGCDSAAQQERCAGGDSVEGGAVLGVLDTARDSWVSREEWLSGGVCAGE